MRGFEAEKIRTSFKILREREKKLHEGKSKTIFFVFNRSKSHMIIGFFCSKPKAQHFSTKEMVSWVGGEIERMEIQQEKEPKQLPEFKMK